VSTARIRPGVRARHEAEQYSVVTYASHPMEHEHTCLLCGGITWCRLPECASLREGYCAKGCRPLRRLNFGGKA
jgi:hypothetical protein